MSKSKNKIEIAYPKLISKKIIENHNNEDISDNDAYWDNDYWNTYQYWDEYCWYTDLWITRNEKIDIVLGINKPPTFEDILPDSLR